MLDKNYKKTIYDFDLKFVLLNFTIPTGSNDASEIIYSLIGVRI